MSGSHRSGSDRDSYRGSGGGQGPGGGYRPDGGGYGTGGYAASGSGSGAHESGGYGSGGYGPGQTGSGPYQSDSGPYQRETGPYQTGSGGYPSDTGGYRSDTGGYRTAGGSGAGGRRDTGGYRSASGGYRSDTGGYRSASGGYRTGSHRVARDGRGGRRWAAILGGVGAGIAVCVLAVVVVLTGVGASGDKEGGQIVGSGATESSPTAKGERSVVPDACTIVAQDLIDRLAPGSERTQADNYQSNERQNQCVWGAYAGDTKRQLTVELRAIAGDAGRTPTDAASRTLISERTADESGKALLPGQKLTDKTRTKDVGDDGYIVYSVDKGQGSGEAVGNIRLANVLVTIHYAGSDDGDPLSSGAATGGATEVAKTVIQALEQG
ncbi:hypothetical protein [Actinomadura geliboluensis]|uniref:hypothetical protein n=1 Tax=Actinomadura geliboluensis TaxID=882440 RepID=UPI00261D8E19|nr:hypothetical protein [Actinomadura geliboluensis]